MKTQTPIRTLLKAKSNTLVGLPYAAQVKIMTATVKEIAKERNIVMVDSK